MRYSNIAVGLTLSVLGFATSAFCEVVEKAKPKAEQTKASEAADEAADQRKIASKLRDILDPVSIENASAKEAFKWWAKTSGISLVLDWKQMEEDGLDPEKKINIEMRNVPAGQVLGLLMKQASPDAPLLFEVTPWYIQITTKARADRVMVTRFYDIQDLVHERPPVRAAPKFDLGSALSSGGGGGGKGGSGGGGGGGSSGGSIFSGSGSDASAPKTGEAGKSAEAQKLIDTVTGSVEPEIWESRGGPASITYLRGFLVVRAPVYVQAQIGLPSRDDTPRPIVGTGGGPDPAEKPTDRPGKGVAGISSSPSKVGGVAR